LTESSNPNHPHLVCWNGTRWSFG